MITALILSSRLGAGISLEKYAYGIKLGDTPAAVRQKAAASGLTIREFPVWTESGPETGLALEQKGAAVLTVVCSQGKIHWIDIREKGIEVEGVRIDADLYAYQQQGLTIQIGEHRDCSPFDDYLCTIGDNGLFYLIDQSLNQDRVRRYKETKNPELLKGVIISGCWWKSN